MMKKDYSLTLMLTLIAILVTSCGDRFDKIQQDPTFKSADQDRRPSINLTDAVRKVPGSDPCISNEYIWSDFGYSCESLLVDRMALYPGKIFCQKWTNQSDLGDKKGTLFIVPGRTESTELYHHLIPLIASEQKQIGTTYKNTPAMDVVICDPAGQGRSGGMGADGDADKFVSDLTRIVQQLGTKGLQNAIIGHSMGGAISTLFMFKQDGILKKLAQNQKVAEIELPRVTAFTFSAPMYAINTYEIKYLEAAFIASSKVASKSGALRYPLRSKIEEMQSKSAGVPTQESPYTDDLALQEKLMNRPLSVIGDPTYNWLYMALATIPTEVFEKAEENFSKNKLPFLLFHSDEDRIVNSKHFDNYLYKSLAEPTKQGAKALLTKDQKDYLLANKISATTTLCNLINQVAKEKNLGGDGCVKGAMVTAGKHNTFMNLNRANVVKETMLFIDNIFKLAPYKYN